jgi:hypothetical protein
MTCASELMAMVSEKRDDSRRWTPRPCTRSPRTTGHDLLPRAKPCCRPRIGRPITRSRGCPAGGLTPPSGTSTTHSCRGVHPPLCCLGRSRRPRRGGIRGACRCLPKPRRARPSRRIPRGPLVSASPAGTEAALFPDGIAGFQEAASWLRLEVDLRTAAGQKPDPANLREAMGLLLERIARDSLKNPGGKPPRRTVRATRGRNSAQA